MSVFLYFSFSTSADSFKQVEGLVMTDLETYYTDYPSSRPKPMSKSDLRNWISDCSCLACKSHKKSAANKVVALFENYADIVSPKTHKYLSPHQYMLLPQIMPAFVFATRKWGKYSIHSPWGLVRD